MTGPLFKPPPQDDRELIRQMSQRLRALESKSSVRIGPEWMLTTHPESGNPILVKPGAVKSLDGTDVSLDPVTIDLATRGFVSKTDAALAVSGGKTKDLGAATQNQVSKDIATGAAQYTADNAYAAAAQALALLEAGSDGVAYNDSFDRPLANDFGPDYDMYRSGGGNNYGTLGDGTTGLTTQLTGSTLQEWYFRRLSLLNTAQQRVSATLKDDIRKGQDDSINAQLKLCGRVDASVASGNIVGRIEAVVERFRGCIGYTLPSAPSTFVNLSGWQPLIAPATGGDSFDFWLGLGGTGHDRYKFALLQNNLTVATADDIPENTAVLLPNRQTAIGVRTSVEVFFYITNTREPPGLQAVNFADRTAPSS